MAVKDRTGETCPICGKGKLFRAEGRMIQEPVPEPESGETRREFTEYECDVCHEKVEAHGIWLREIERAHFDLKSS